MKTKLFEEPPQERADIPPIGYSALGFAIGFTWVWSLLTILGL